MKCTIFIIKANRESFYSILECKSSCILFWYRHQKSSRRNQRNQIGYIWFQCAYHKVSCHIVWLYSCSKAFLVRMDKYQLFQCHRISCKLVFHSRWFRSFDPLLRGGAWVISECQLSSFSYRCTRFILVVISELRLQYRLLNFEYLDLSLFVAHIFLEYI